MPKPFSETDLPPNPFAPIEDVIDHAIKENAWLDRRMDEAYDEAHREHNEIEFQKNPPPPSVKKRRGARS